MMQLASLLVLDRWLRITCVSLLLMNPSLYAPAAGDLHDISTHIQTLGRGNLSLQLARVLHRYKQ